MTFVPLAHSVSNVFTSCLSDNITTDFEAVSPKDARARVQKLKSEQEELSKKINKKVAWGDKMKGTNFVERS